ncbi:MAG: hypothetical protein JNL32_11045 [Candidatus Kapabacteria bacterium]|nr:hypothetical protein [Candidatus Kapabacteria bacterium]
MKICILQPDYSQSTVDYRHYDPPRHLAPLVPDWQVDEVYLRKTTVYAQLAALQHAGYDCFVNLCEGYLEWDVPSIDVIHSLAMLNLPHTGPTASLYDPPKPVMKYAAYSCGVATPASALLRKGCDIITETRSLRYPLFVKPAKAGDSLGVDEHSLVATGGDAIRQCEILFRDYEEVLAEEYVAGREFTVLVAANADGGCEAFLPVEYVFPQGTAYKTYALKTSALHPGANVPCTDAALDSALCDAACRIFTTFGGVGYARMDFRVDDTGTPWFLELNFTCSVFYSGNERGSADYILEYDGIGQAGFLHRIVEEGISRHRSKQPLHEIVQNGLQGYGIRARRDITVGELIFKGEGRNHRLVTRAYIEREWSAEQKEEFYRYAISLGNGIYILWSDNPCDWAPQNHSCSPNTGYRGLDVIALRAIECGEELTLDYAQISDEFSSPFECTCGSDSCRGIIRGGSGLRV